MSGLGGDLLPESFASSGFVGSLFGTSYFYGGLFTVSFLVGRQSRPGLFAPQKLYRAVMVP